MAQIIDGKALAAAQYDAMRLEVEGYASKYGRPPGLCAVLVGDDPASTIYVRNKENAARKVGLYSEVHRLPAETTQEELLSLISRLNADSRIDGILVQLPLPSHIDREAVIAAIDPGKDVDGFAGMKLGITAGPDTVPPCTPRAVVSMIKSTGQPIDGAHVLVIGRGMLVGKPLSALLLKENATLSVAHSHTKNLKELSLSADILVSATGHRGLVSGDMVKPGAVVIDVGISRTPEGKIAGDVDFEAASKRAGWITPVPGGVGPMTIAMVIRNTIDCALRHV